MATNYKSKRKSMPNKGSHGKQGSRDKFSDKNQCDDRIRRDYSKGDINDPSYYISDANLRAQLPNISFNQFVNVPVDIARKVSDNTTAEITFPSCMRINLNPSAGYTDDNYISSGVNLAALSMYTKLSANNAKTSVYAPQDLTTLIYAVSELIAISSHIARIFGVCRLYNYRNRSFPEKIVEYLGVQYQDLIDNFSDYRSLYNNLMVAASKIPIPANITLLQKSSQLYSNVYVDMEGSAMAQTYIFVPNSTWYLDEKYNDNGTGLRTLEFGYSDPPVGTVSMIKLLSKLDLMINSLLQSTTLNAIYSDILRLADKEGLPLYQFTTIDDAFVVVPVYNPEVRMWINNLVVTGSPIGTDEDNKYTPKNDVVPVAGFNSISYKPKFQVNAGYALKPIINFDHSNVSSDEIIEATRLSVAWHTIDFGDTGWFMELVALPDHYVTAIALMGAGNASVIEFPFLNSGSLETFSWKWSNFDWAPFIYTLDASSNFKGVLGDTNYYTTIDYQFLKRLNDASYQGLLELR